MILPNLRECGNCKGREGELRLDPRAQRRFSPPVLREQLKSKIHRAVVSEADVDYEGSIEIPGDLMDAVDLWDGEKVLVTSATSGHRLETYAQRGPEGTGRIIMNGGAALLIKQGERITIMAFVLSAERVLPCKVLMNEHNEVTRRI